MFALATFLDVQKKGLRIFQEGGVKINSIYPNKRRPLLVVGTVQGDTGVYETVLQFTPTAGRNWKNINYLLDFRNISMPRTWKCSCKWHQYAFYRSRPYKHLEAQPCSHAIALFHAFLDEMERAPAEEVEEKKPWYEPEQLERDREQYELEQAQRKPRWRRALDFLQRKGHLLNVDDYTAMRIIKQGGFENMDDIEHMDLVTLFNMVANEHKKYQRNMRARNIEELLKESNDFEQMAPEEVVKNIENLSI